MASAARSLNYHVLRVFAPVLVAAGVLGFVVPARLSLMSGAAPYNVFHIAFGVVGLAALASRRERAIAGFNLGFGLVDLWQALAGAVGVFPAGFFALRPADHVLHVVIGALLVAVGARGVRASGASNEGGASAGGAAALAGRK